VGRGAGSLEPIRLNAPYWWDMKRLASLVVLTACSHSRPVTTHPAPATVSSGPAAPAPAIDSHLIVSAELARELRSGFSFELVLDARDTTTSVGQCTLAFSVWEELFEVRLPATTPLDPPRLTSHTKLDEALAACIDPARLAAARPRSGIVVRVSDAGPLSQASSDRPWCGITTQATIAWP
jgi:hypothetical protein